MPEFIFEFILELVLDGSIEVLGEKKVPLALRVAAGIIVGIVYVGIVALLLFEGISEKNWAIAVLGAGIGIFFGAGFISVIKKRRKQNARQMRSDKEVNLD